MNKLFLLVAIIMSGSIFALAQSSDYNKNEYYVGFSNQQVETGGQRDGLNGVQASYVRNVSRYFGAKADFSAAYQRRNTPAGNVTIEDDRDVYNFLGGVQIKDNASEARLQPFGHVLLGAAHNRNRFVCPTCLAPIPSLNRNDTGFASAFGGGLDVKLTDKVKLRAVQVDYNPVRNAGRTNDNVRFGIGVVFK